jgi:hypothetical protein
VRALLSSPLRRFALLVVAVGSCALLPGCNLVPHQRPPPPPPPADTPANDRDLAAAVVMSNTFQTMQRLTQAAPAEQAEIVSAARDAFQRDPRGEAQLRYALLLATPGHPARNVTMAQKLLRELAAQPEALVPVERAVVLVELAELDREVDLATDNEQLQGAALRNDQLRSAADQKRLQAQIEENTRLRKELEAAQAKLDAVATIERNLTERRTGTEIVPGPGAGGTPGAAGSATAPGSSAGAGGSPAGGSAAGSAGGTSSGPVVRAPAGPGGSSAGGSNSGASTAGANGSGSTAAAGGNGAGSASSNGNTGQ